MTKVFTPKSAKKFSCKECDFECSKRSDWSRHTSTQKHKIRTNTNDFTPKNAEQYHCNCGKKYKHASSLWNHKKNCENEGNHGVQQTQINPSIDNENLVNYLMKENLELKKMIMENYGRNVTNNINNNQNFNINIFLNEQCKDAMNLTEFLESIQLNLQDLMKIADDGQTIGVSNILIDKLNSMDVFKRPVHCSDVKNETIYIKDQDIWEKEEKNKPKLKNVLDELIKKSIDAMPCMDDDPDAYVKTISEVLKDPRQDKKIISNVVKEISIN